MISFDRMYGHHYSPTTISNISKATQENVAAFHERSLEANYSVLFLDGTYLPLRRGTVSKECIHIALGVIPEGQKAVLGYEIAPNENNASWSPPVRQASKPRNPTGFSCSYRWLQGA